MIQESWYLRMSELKLYTPFLKLKQNEIMALKELENGIKSSLIPFFDFPNTDDEYTPTSFVKKAKKEYKRIKTHLWTDIQLYLDTFDINDIDIGGQNSYEYLLDLFSDLNVIPVIGLDRSIEHKEAILNKLSKLPRSANKIIAFRIVADDFQSYTAVEDEIEELFQDLLDESTNVDLIIDNRLCLNCNVESTVTQIAKFSNMFHKNYPVRKIIVTGSSIPPLLNEVCSTNSFQSIVRKELLIFNKLKTELDLSLELGDYTTVSPLYSDPNTMAKMNGASKLIYANDLEQYIWRGGRVRTFGAQQYNEHIRELINKSYYRGQSYSWADKRFFDTRNDSDGFWVNSIIKPLINAHISYMSKTHNH